MGAPQCWQAHFSEITSLHRFIGDLFHFDVVRVIFFDSVDFFKSHFSLLLENHFVKKCVLFLPFLLESRLSFS